MVDRAAIFADVLKRNALRREASLPLLAVRPVYLKEVARAAWTEFVAQHEGEVRALVLKQQRQRRGQAWPTSTGGRWALDILTARELSARFSARRG